MTIEELLQKEWETEKKEQETTKTLVQRLQEIFPIGNNDNANVGLPNGVSFHFGYWDDGSEYGFYPNTEDYDKVVSGIIQYLEQKIAELEEKITRRNQLIKSLRKGT